MPNKKHLRTNDQNTGAQPAMTETVDVQSDTPGGPVASFASEMLAGEPKPDVSAPRQQGPKWPSPAPAAIAVEKTSERHVAPVARDSMARVTARLGARNWATNKRFEWAKAPNGHHYEFTRYYFEQLLLVDVWPNSSPSSRKEAQRKRDCIDGENTLRVQRGEKPIGLLAVVRGAIIPDEYFDRALAGQTFALIDRAVEGVLV